jgi:hypothetical protein
MQIFKPVRVSKDRNQGHQDHQDLAQVPAPLPQGQALCSRQHPKLVGRDTLFSTDLLTQPGKDGGKDGDEVTIDGMKFKVSCGNCT